MIRRVTFSYVLVLCIQLCAVGLFAQSNEYVSNENNPLDYREYHSGILRAKGLYFLENRTSEALSLAESLFNSEYQPFLRDVITFAQIAKLESLEYQSLLHKAFSLGMGLNHLLEFPIFEEDYLFFKNDSVGIKYYTTVRKEYLEGYDYFRYLLLRNIFYRDQVYIYVLDNFSNYRNYLKHMRPFILDQIRRDYPSEKILGPHNPDLIKDLIDYHILPEEYILDADSIRLPQGHPSELQHRFMFVILIHYIRHYEDPDLIELLDENFVSGYIHPRDLVHLKRIYSWDEKKQEKVKPRHHAPIMLSPRTICQQVDEKWITKVDIQEKNEIRKKHFVESVELDCAKLEKSDNTEANFFYGFLEIL